MSASDESLDPYQFLQITINPDGTLTRSLDDPRSSATSDPDLPISVLTKDLTINQSNNTWVRLFLPRKALHNHPSNKFPLIVFFHGGGFIYFSAASTRGHDFCLKMATDIEVVVASVEYRLAPEHRLPAAYDDAVEALHWLAKANHDDWLRDFVDYSNCYVMGNSAGGTIAYHAGLCVATEGHNLEPMKIKGLILRQPFFGGTHRTDSEVRLKRNPIIPMVICDLCWELALPEGENSDHEYSNLTAGDGPEKMEKIREMGWTVIVSGNGGDPLIDRERELVRIMEEKGVKVVTDFEEEGSHGIEFRNPSVASRLIQVLKHFISSSKKCG